MKFKKGDIVVVVDDSEKTSIKNGDVYTVCHVYNCGRTEYIHIRDDMDRSFYAYRFKKLDIDLTTKTDIDNFVDMLNL